jgi:endonuclease/exonuclease/phosphatase family metal-dependent hydrolase
LTALPSAADTASDSRDVAADIQPDSKPSGLASPALDRSVVEAAWLARQEAIAKERRAAAMERAVEARRAAALEARQEQARAERRVARNAARAAAEEAARLAREREQAAQSPTTTFRTATINVLGDSHTRRGGDKPGFRSGAARMGGVVGILRSQNLDVVGFQEFERPQKAAFNRLAGGWDLFTGTERGRDSIAYRTGIWEYVQGGTRTIPYFHGNPAPLPWVTLRHRETGRVVSFISIHNPTSSARRGNNARHRIEATRREIALVRTLSSGGNPVVLLGDFNERGQAFCMVTRGGDLIAANGGSHSGNCAPPRRSGIDWIFGTRDIVFSDYLRHQDARVRHITDHPVVIARATITERLPGAD